MAEEVAFFRFDSNADAVASDIAGAMRRINESLSTARRASPGELATNTGGLTNVFNRAESELNRGKARVQELLSKGLSPRDFQAQFRDIVRSTVGSIPQTMANELARAPQSIAGRAPIREIAAGLGQTYVNTLAETVRAGGGSISRMTQDLFRDSVRDVALKPVDYGNEAKDIDRLRNQLRAEQLLKADPALGGATRARASQQGFSADYMKRLQERTVVEGPEGGLTFHPTDAARVIRDLEQAQARAIPVAGRLAKEMLAEASAAEQLATALRLVDAETLKTAGGRTSTGVGEHYRTTTKGALFETNPLRVQAADESVQSINRQMQNGQRLMENWERVVPTGSFRVLGQEVYKLSAFGAERVTHEVQVAEALAAQERILARQMVAEQKLATQARSRAAGEAAKNAGFAGGIANRFTRGGSSALTNLGSSVASAASFSIGYGALFGAVGGARDTLKEFNDYQDSLTDLQVAARDTSIVTNAFVDDLGDMSRIVGENLGSALDTAARGIRAFGNPLSDTREELQQIGLEANEAANKLALVASKSLKDATGDTVAIGTAYGLQPDQLGQISDAVANAKKLGADAGQISQGLASISTATQSAGYTVDQAAALVSLVQSRTDESGQAVATRLTKIFQVTAGSTGKKLGQELGVDTNQSVRKQLEDYAQRYTDPNTTKGVKDRISSALGGTANLKELLPVLQEGTALQRAYADAAASAGQGTTEFVRKSTNLVGTLKTISGTVKAVQVDFARTKLLDPFGALIYTLEPVLNLLDRMLKTFNSLPDPIQKIAAGLLDVAAAAKLVAIIQTARNVSAAPRLAEEAVAAQVLPRVSQWGMLPGAVTGAAPKAEAAAIGAAAAAGVEARQVEAAAIAVAAEERAAVEAMNIRGIAAATAIREGEEVAAGAASVGLLGGLKSIGKFLLNPWTLGIGAIVGGAVIFEKIMTGVDQRNEFLRSYGGTSKAFERVDGSAASLRTAANDLRSTAGNIAKSDSNFVSKDTQHTLVKELDRQRKDLGILARQVAAEDRRQATNAPKSVFGDGGVISTVSELSAGLKVLSDTGTTATERVRLMIAALEDTPTPATGKRYEPAALAADLGTGIIGALKGALPKSITESFPITPGESGYNTSGGVTGSPTGYGLSGRTATSAATSRSVTKTAAELYPEINALNSSVDIAAAVEKRRREMHLKAGAVLTDAQKTALVQAAVDAYNLGPGVVGKEAQEIRDNLFDALMAQQGLAFDPLKGTADQQKGRFPFRTPQGAAPQVPQLNGKGPLTRGQIEALLLPGETAEGRPWGGLGPELEEALSDLPARDDGTQRRRVLKQNLDFAKEAQRRGRLSGANVGELNKIVDNAEDAYGEAQIEHLNELRRTAQNNAAGNRDKVKAIGLDSLRKQIATAGDDTRLLGEVMVNANNASLDIVQAELNTAADLADKAELLHEMRTGTATGGGRSGDPITATHKSQARRDYEAFVGKRATSNIGDKDGVLETGSDTANYQADKRTAWQKAAQAAAAMISPDATVKTARAALDVARSNLDAAEAGSEEYNAAYQDVLAKRIALTDSIRTHADLARRSMLDPDDTVGLAAEDLRAARAALEGATRGTDKYNQAAGEVRQKTDAFEKAQADKMTSIGAANAARLGGGLAGARDQLDTAARQMRVSAKGTKAWWDALGSFYNGQRAMREAVQAYAASKDQLRGDITDPVENARDTLRAAVRKLVADRRAGQGRDVIAEDQVAVREGRNAESAARFSQRFSDMQTAEDLGRISFRKYMSYLDHEHERLTKIKNRTRQQQDQLDQVDQAMKSALDAMDGQFNLGDINTNGLVYQVRRFQAEGRAAAASSQLTSQVTNTQNVRIDINGADTAKVRTILDTYLRIGGGQRQSLTRRKV